MTIRWSHYANGTAGWHPTSPGRACYHEILTRRGLALNTGVATDALVALCPVGKVTPEALYLHVSALPTLPPDLLRAVRRARHLAAPPLSTTLLKISRRKPLISFLSYPSFDREPHPAIASAVTVNLASGQAAHRSWTASPNPPVLHRKETFVAPGYPHRELFARLTAAEEGAGLLAEPSAIGTREGWNRRCRDLGYALSGHRLVRDRVLGP